MKVIAAYQLLNGIEFLEASVHSILPHMDHILLMHNKRPWNNPDSYVDDGTWDLCLKLADQYPSITAHESPGTNEIDERYHYIQMIKDLGGTHYFVIDFDEAYCADDLTRLTRFAEENEQYQGIYVTRHTYWKSLRWRIDPPEPTPALAIVDVRDPVRFVQPRHISGPNIHLRGVFQHHFSYVRDSDEKIRDKIMQFSHSHEIIPGWFENVYLEWTPDKKNLHPTHPDCYKKALPVDESFLPPSFQPLMDKFDREGSYAWTAKQCFHGGKNG